MGNRQMSVASDTKLLEEEIGCEMRAILRPKGHHDLNQKHFLIVLPMEAKEVKPIIDDQKDILHLG